MDAVDRIFELVGEKFKEQKEFASALRVNDKTVSAWRTRRAKSYTKYLPQIAEALGTTTEYLLTGEGQLLRNRNRCLFVVSDSDTVSEDTIKAAFFEGGQDLTPAEMDELWEDAKDYIQYKLDQRRRKKK